MRKFVFMSSLIFLCFIFQTSFLGFFNFFKIVPNFSLILLVIFSMQTDGITGGVLGLITGILYDAMIYDVFGVYTLIYFFVGSIVGNYSDVMLRENFFIYSAVTATSTVVMHLLLHLILFFLKFKVKSLANILPEMVFQTVINAVLVVFVLKIVIYLIDKFNVKA